MHSNSPSVVNIQITIALSVDKVCILIKILAESHMAFDLGDRTQTDQPYFLPLFNACYMGISQRYVLLMP